MGRHYTSVDARCPFYRYEEPRAVYCEGMDPGSTIKLYYEKDVDVLIKYKAKFCKLDWEKCPVARMLIEKLNQ